MTPQFIYRTVSAGPVAKWLQQIGDSTVAEGILDRIVHRAHRIELRGESMRGILGSLPPVLALALLVSCNRPSPLTTQAAAPDSPVTRDPGKHEIRITGLIQAVRFVKILVPQIQGQYSNLTLTRLIPNGTKVQPGDVIATFDPTTQMDDARDAQAKYEDLGHQVDQKAAENRAAGEKRTLDLRTAEGDLVKPELELKKGPVLGDIDKAEAQARAEGARTRVASIHIQVEELPEGLFLATSNELPGLVAQGRTVAEVLENCSRRG